MEVPHDALSPFSGAVRFNHLAKMIEEARFRDGLDIEPAAESFGSRLNMTHVLQI
jgi:hypothetical protein